jgi:hypothetical protein
MPTIAEKYVAGYIFNADGTPEVGSTVSATISERIIRTGSDNLVLENDETVTGVTDGTGRFVLSLHPNNQPGDNPLNTNWTITEPSGHQETIFIPYNHSQGNTDPTAIAYTSLITTVPNNPDPGEQAALEARVERLEAALTASSTMDQAGLQALSPPVSTALVDAAESVGSLATSTSNGLLSSSLFNTISTLQSGQSNDLANMVKRDAMGLIVPGAADPTSTGFGGRLYQSATDLSINLQFGSAAGRTRLAPALSSPSWLATSDLTFSSTSYVDISTFTLVANATYHVTGAIFYSADQASDLFLRFINIPTGATLRWGGYRLASIDTGAEGVAEADFNIATGTEPHAFGGNGVFRPLVTQLAGVLKTGSTAGTLTMQGRKEGTANASIFAASAVFVVRYA